MGRATVEVHETELERLQRDRAEIVDRLAESPALEAQARLDAIRANPAQRSDAKGARGDSPVVKIRKDRDADARALASIDAELAARTVARQEAEAEASAKALKAFQAKAESLNEDERAIFLEAAAWLETGLGIYGRYVDLLENRPWSLAGLDIRDEQVAEDARNAVQPLVQPVPRDMVAFVDLVFKASVDPDNHGAHEIAYVGSQPDYEGLKQQGFNPNDHPEKFKAKLTPVDVRPFSFGPHIVCGLPPLPDLRHLDRHAPAQSVPSFTGAWRRD